MTRVETVEQDVVERMLATGKALGRIVILVMDMQVVVAYSLNHLLAQEEIVHERLCCLARELHHHSGRSVGVHVRVLACDIIRLDVDDLLEYVTGLRIAGNAALVTVSDVLLGNILTATLHELQLHHILDCLDTHLRISLERDTVSNLTDERHVLTLVCVQHGLTDSRDNLFFIEADNTSVALHNCLNHIYLRFFISSSKPQGTSPPDRTRQTLSSHSKATSTNPCGKRKDSD